VAARRPLVSVVTPTRDGPQHLRRFLTTIARTACAEPFEIVLVDNGTTDPEALALLDRAARTSDGRVVVVRDDRPFNFAALSNRGAAVAGGDILVFANNDVAFCWPDWLDRLLAAARDPAVGVAGARLVYPDGRLQHAGVVLAGEARVRHTKRALPDDVPGAWRPVAAVTGALMALRGEVFHNLGGFRADRYPVLYNDIDLCLRAMASGAMNVLVPGAMAVHHEWATTGRTRASGGLFARGGPVWRHARSLEADRFRQDWHAMLDADPCYRTGCDPLAADFRPAVGGAGRGGGAGLSSEVER
jgi:GT2 family glycosyltransferase